MSQACLKCGHSEHIFAMGHCVCGCAELVTEWTAGPGEPGEEDAPPEPLPDPPAEKDPEDPPPVEEKKKDPEAPEILT